ncbi:sigma factor [Pseudactinotalea sp. Z1748]|uniref:RNA polymerase sigma factor n=1 Tax=Pseudactinotalea sp. Z1748 TaxID=3413027 RepID=UPI003C7B9109
MTMLQATNPAAQVLLAEVDHLAGYVRRRVLDPGEVDEALQAIRVQVWRSAHRYDPDLGAPGAFVFGIAAKVTTWHRAGLASRRAQERGLLSSYPVDGTGCVSQDRDGRVLGVDVGADRTTVSDPLEVLLAGEGPGPWLQVVADAASHIEWRVIVALARHDGDQVRAAAALQMPVRTLRAARGRVQALALTGLAAQLRFDDGLHADPVLCVPPAGGLREIIGWLPQSAEATAAGLGLSPGTVRNRRALARRALAVAEEVAALR